MARPLFPRFEISRRPVGCPPDCGRNRTDGEESIDGADAPFRSARRTGRRFPDAGRLLRASALAFVLTACAACGLTDDERDEKDRYVYVPISDTSFSSFCLEKFDTDGDGLLSRYEARCVQDIDCSGRDIATLGDLSVFENLRTLDCSHNKLTKLDIRHLYRLERLDCSDNDLESLQIGASQAFVSLRCSYNRLQTLDLGAASSLRQLEACANEFRTLDLRACSHTLQADVTSNPSLATLYCFTSQEVWANGPTEILRD